MWLQRNWSGLLLALTISWGVAASELTCPTGWFGIGGSKCYKLYSNNTDRRMWHRAAEVCETYGSHLVSIKDQYENNALGDAVGEPYWIGLRTMGNELKWHSGVHITENQAFWGDRQPDSSPGDCVVAGPNQQLYVYDRPYTWSFSHCLHIRSFVCEREAAPEGSFHCFLGGQVSEIYRCDGHDDCADASDEMDCLDDCHYHLSGTGNIDVNTYQNSRTCMWAIETPLGTNAYIQFTRFNTDGADYAHVYIGSVVEINAKRVASLSGTGGNVQRFRSHNNMLLIKFSPDSFVNTGPNNQVVPGFSASYGYVSPNKPEDQVVRLVALVNPQAYSTVLNDVGGVSSFVGTTDYVISIKAKTLWQIITVQIDSFDLHDSDEIIFSDGDFPDNVLVLGKLCATCDNYNTVFSTGSYMAIYLRTERESAKNVAFFFTYKQGCHVTTTGRYGVLFSPGYPGNMAYPNFVTCTWQINSDKPLAISFSGDSALQGDTYGRISNGDYVQIYADGTASTGTPVHTGDGFTNSDLAGQTFQSSNGEMFIRFTSSPTRNARGFKAYWSNDCEDPAYNDYTLVNGQVAAASYHYTAVNHLTCASGYDFQQQQIPARTSKAILTCGYMGVWDMHLQIPRCTPVYCGDVPSVVNAFIKSSTGPTYENTATYECFTGSTLVPAAFLTGSDITCTFDGTWSARPTCQAASCPFSAIALSGPNLHGELRHGDGSQIGSIIDYECDAGYELVREPILFCQTDGSWSSTTPSCQKLTCLLPAMDHSNFQKTDLITYQQTVGVSCNTGYTHEDPTVTSVTCQADRSLTQLPVCVNIVECDQFHPCSDFCVDTEGSFYCTCPSGYYLHTDEATCLDVDECQLDTDNCDQGCSNNAGSYTCSCSTPGYVPGYVLYTADGTSGYAIPPSEDGSLPTDTYHIGHTCVLRECPPPDPINNGDLLTNRVHHRYGDCIEYMCELGYIPRSTVLTCLETGMWSGPAPTCQAASCPTDAVIRTADAATYPPGPYPYGSSLNMQCDVATTSFTKQRHCVYDRASDVYRLFGAEYQCGVVDCGQPDAVAGSNFSTVSNTLYQATFQFTCGQDQVPTGTSGDGTTTVTCGADRQWNLGSLQCFELACIDPGYPAGGDITATSFADNSEVTFTCARDGYDLSHSTPMKCSGESWVGTVPMCNDVQPPTFVNCDNFPSIELPKYGLLAPELSRLNIQVSDNTGIESLTISPSNANSTLVVDSAGTVRYTARDYAGNTATCQVAYHVYDETPPVIWCQPLYEVVILDDTHTATYSMSHDMFTTTEGDSGLKSISMSSTAPMTFTAADLYKTFTYTVQVKDKNDNIATCKAQLFVTVNECTQSAFPTPLSADKTCTETTSVQFNGRAYSCSLKCQDEYTFQDSKEKVVTCDTGINGGEWSIDWIPACVRDTIPPVISCPPAQDVFLTLSTDEQREEFTAKLTATSISDLNEIASITSSISEYTFTAASLYQPQEVTVTVLDKGNNLATCTYQYMAKRRNPNLNAENGPSDKWFRKLLKRHPQLSERTPENLDKARQRISTQKTADEWFHFLRGVLEKYAVTNKPAQIFNVDESGWSGKEKAKTRVIAPRSGHVFRNKVMTNDHVTANLCISADGKFLPTMIIFQGALPHRAYQDGIPDDWLFGVSESGYMDGNLFVSWFQEIFVPNCGRERPVVLILDNHDSHVTLPLVEAAISNDVVLVGLPGHTTHFLQPLDVKVIGPLKARFATMANNLGFASSQMVIGKAKFPVVLKYAIDQATPASIQEAFAVTGIQPFNPQAIDASQLVPPSFEAKSTEELPAATQITCHACGSFLVNPLVSQGLIPEAMARRPHAPADETSNRKKETSRVRGARFNWGRNAAPAEATPCSPLSYPGVVYAEEPSCSRRVGPSPGYDCTITALPGYILRDHGQSTVVSCNDGAGWDEIIPACVTDTTEQCSLGTEPVGDGTCRLCDVGSYRSANYSSCVGCPPSSTSTYVTGATSSNDCYGLCGLGLYSATGLSPCSACPRGTFWQDSQTCAQCDQQPGLTGYTTGGVGATRISQCVPPETFRVACPRGTKRDVSSCVKCPIGEYQDQEDRTLCNTCGNGRSTYFQGATSFSMCFLECEAGFYSTTGLSPCTPCGVGRYSLNSTTYENCGAGQTTRTNTAGSINECIDQCPAGQFSYGGYDFGGACRNCPANYYQDTVRQTSCKRCSTTTEYSASSGLTSSAQCLDAVTNLCYTGRCQNGGQCVIRDNTYVCNCEIGYYGRTCEVQVRYCDSQPCYHGGVCTETRQGHSCDCLGLATGTNCEDLIKTCISGKSETCKNGADCLNRPGNTECLCRQGFSGNTCLNFQNICSPNPCQNSGSCSDVSFGDNLRRKCTCHPGFTGRNCETNIDNCAADDTCLYGGDCTDHISYYFCQCLPGYGGMYCQNRADPCLGVSCGGGGFCNDDFTQDLPRCICQPGYHYGAYVQYSIQKELAPSDFGNSNGFLATVDDCREQCTSDNQCDRFTYDVLTSMCYTWNKNDNLDMIFYTNYNTYTKDTVYPDDDFYSLWYNLDTPANNLGNNDNEDRSSLNSQFGLHICGGTEPLDAECQRVDGLANQAGITCDTNGLACDLGLTLCVDYKVRFKCAAHRVFLDNICTAKTDYCVDQPCENNGFCSNLAGAGYSCTCPSGYTGQNCQTNINDCENSPCENGGTCTDGVDTFTCDCPPQWTGTQCHVHVNYCQVNLVTCNNHGICRGPQDLATHVCDCYPGYMGDDCQTEINRCESSPCIHDGTCVTLFNSYRCYCVPGFGGTNCEHTVDNCLVDGLFCMNPATCHTIFDNYYCECPANIFGDNCEHQPNPCGSYNKCLNGGDCDILASTSMECGCPGKYSGDGCQTLVDHCGLTNYCKNDGQCSVADTTSGYTCQCAQGFENTDCDTLTNNCIPGACPGGTCYNDVSKSYCRCPLGKTGTNCMRDFDRNYDLFFNHPYGLAFAWIPVWTLLENVNAAAVSLWVRYTENGGTGIYHTMFLGDDLQDSDRFMEFMHDGIVVYIGNGNTEKLLYTHNFVLNDGNWHNVVFNYDMTTGTVYLVADSISHTQIQNNNIIFPDNTYKFWTVLGCQFDQIAHQCVEGGNNFHGLLSQVNWYHRLLHRIDDIPRLLYISQRQMIFSEDTGLSDVTIVWNEYQLESGVSRNIPSEAGPLICDDPGRTLMPGIPDSLPPCTAFVARHRPRLDMINGCPDDIVVYSATRITSVSWQEPVFHDVVDMIRPEYQSGGVFHWGMYSIVYIAVGANENTAVCHFTIYVQSSQCQSPPDPVGGSQTTVDNNPIDYKGSDIYCYGNNYKTDRHAPKLFTCDLTGSWNIKKQFNKFRYPSCGLIKNTARVRIELSVAYYISTQACHATKTNAISRTQQALKAMQLETNNDLCGDIECSDAVITVNCSSPLRRRKRQTDPVVALLEVIIPSAAESFSWGGEQLTMEQYATYKVLGANVLDFSSSIPQGAIDPSTFTITATVICPTGQVYLDGDCVECGAGNYYTTSVSGVEETLCHDCPLATYQDELGTTACKACGVGMTTEMTGSYEPTACKKKCAAGWYFDNDVGDCVACEIGYYQEREGQFYCDFCLSGETTSNTGSTSPNDCKPTPVVSPFTLTLHILDIDFSLLLLNPDSFLYVEHKKNVIDNMMAVLDNILGFHSIELLGFRQANSVYADFVIYVNQSGSVQGTIDALQEVVSRGWINDLSVDSGYFITSTQRGYIMVEEITQWPAKLYKGTDSELIITCNILTIGYLGAEDFTYWWTYNGIVLQPKSTSRFTLSTSTLDIPQQKQSRLKLTPLRSYDSGTYACFVSHKASGAEAGRNITLGVISQPVVTLTPGSLTVNEGADVALECKVIHPLDRQFEFRWYRNGEVLQSRAGETFIPDETSVQLLITAITETTKFGCEAENEAGNGTRATSYIGVIPATVDPEEPTACNVALDYRGREWPITAVDTFAEQDCPSQTLGTVMRSCKQNGEWATANYNCVQETIRTIQQQINQAQDGLGSANLTSSLGDLAHATDIDELLEGDMLAVIDTLASVAVVAEETITAAGETETETQNFLEVASNLLDEKHKDTWDADIDQGQPGAIDVAQVVESFIKAKVKQLSSSTNESFTKHYNNTNIFCEIGRSNEADTSAYTFPNRGSGLPSWIEDTTTALYIPAESFSGMAREYSSQVYRNLPDIVVKKLQTNGQIQDSGSMDINSDVTIAFQSQQPVTNLDPPARITFQHSSPNYSRPICVFWDFGETTWSSQGCEMVSTSETHTVCACDHFTNFAVLMSPGKTPGADQLALSIISAIGCGVSLLCLVCTVAAHLRVWRLVKSDRSTLLMHLCVALIVAYVVFLAGINRAENKDVCTAIAALLHYFWLVVFFLMLAEGIEIAVSVTYVFVTKSRVKWLVPLAWGLPAVIVGVSLGVSRLDGYGTDTFCWLSTESGLLWAFVGPAAFVILVNFIIIIVVFRKMFKTSAMLAKTDKDKAKTGVRSLCVLLPVLGLSWVFGIFSVNEDLVAFQYIFAICNALQGFFIFLFHCCFNRQVKDAWKQIQIRKKSLASYEDSYKKQSSSVTGTTTYYSADGSRKQSNDKQADRQMQDLAKKEKRGSSNIFNTTPNNKLDNDKKPNVDAALEDVKISNILCESDKMGEAAGISSILNTPDKQPESDRATTRTEEGCGISRETHQSSRKYDYIDTSRMETFGTPQPKPPGYEQLLSPQRQTQSRPYDNLTDGGDQGLAGRVNLRDKPDGRRVGDRPRSYELDARRNDPPRDYEAVAQQERSTPRGYEPSSRPDDTRGRREESNYMKGSGKSSYKHSRSSRSDEDIEGSHRSQDISEALPTRYKPTQMKAKLQQPEPTRQTGPKTFGTSKEAAQAKKNMAKKKYPKDRSQVYQYPYDVNYLGPQSRHSSLENMSSNYGYSPYSGMQSGPGHSGSRPAHQTPSQWDQYGQYGRTRPQQRRGDYW